MPLPRFKGHCPVGFETIEDECIVTSNFVWIRFFCEGGSVNAFLELLKSWAKNENDKIMAGGGQPPVAPEVWRGY